MKTTRFLSLLIIATALAFGMQKQRPVQAIALEAKLNYPFISEKGGTAFLQLTVTTADIGVQKQRKPMNLSIVLDRSGSMGSERKMDNAKKAFLSLIDQLHHNDILSVIVYDDAIEVLRKAKWIGSDKRAIKKLVDEIYPRGSTNLGGGLVEGLRQVEVNANREYVNRVVLLSDGLANVGMTNPNELNRIAQKYRRQSISITTMGVGLDYNENLMMGIAESGGGNYYFIERSHDLASIVRREFDMISSVLAQNGSIHVKLLHGVRVRDVIGCEFNSERDTYIIPVGDLYSNDRKEFTLELSVPEGTGAATIATGTLRYDANKISSEYPVFATSIKFTRDYAAIEKNRDMDVQAKADIALSTRKVEEAMKSLDEGNVAEAEQQLKDAKDMIKNSPAASAAGASGESVRSQVGRIESYQKSAKEDDTRRAKKAIQYDNYKTKKNQ